MKIFNYIGMVVGITAITLSWVWFGWKLSLVLFLAFASNNMNVNRCK